MCIIPDKTLMVWLPLVVLLITIEVTTAQTLKQTRKPLVNLNPFISIWNAPTEQCKRRYNIDLDLSVFDIVINANETLSGSNVTIFYHTHLGLYPYFTDDGKPVHGGVPQNESLENHLKKAEHDINRLIPGKGFQGLGVIDWENWRPLWDRNWGSKSIYRTASVELVKQRHPDWSEAELKKLAKEEYDTAAMNFMNETVHLAQHLRPDGLWGYYLFPDCYNYDYKERPHSYTGKCPKIEYKRNDLLWWMWKSSSALFPSIYLDYVLKSSPNSLKFVHNRVKEAIRVASMEREDTLPVFMYARPFYSYTLNALSMADLIHTIGESAAMGAAGVVLWGGMQYASTKESCTIVKNYVDGPLGHYMMNVTSAAKLCSRVLCGKHGRCVRKNEDSMTYLHLNPKNFKIKTDFSGTGPRHFVTGKHRKEDLHYMEEHFQCQCYKGWTGMYCETPTPKKLGHSNKVERSGLEKSLVPFSIILYVIIHIIILVTYNG
ncbi:hyaluronidase-1-like isoform 1-T3 [Discoglossus pictus]